jgi:hypothetical protein
MSRDPTVNEWTSVRDQFNALVREGSDNIEDIFDAQFRRRFCVLINRAAAEREHIKSATLPDSNLILHLRKYTAHQNLPKKRKRNRIPLGSTSSSPRRPGL